MQLKAVEQAPGFTLPDADMESASLTDYRGKRIVLFFYPKDGTPGCTLEATDFSDHEPDFGERNCVLFGISRDDRLKHAEFRDKEGIGVSLLADTEGEVCTLYGVLQAQEVDGQVRHCIAR